MNQIINEKKAFKDRLLPIPTNSGFQMEGYFVWCGSVVKGEHRKYHMFASRWPISRGFPNGYRTHSEIVRAVADEPEGPYSFQEVVLAGRGGSYWDAQMAHNPNIIRHKDQYILYYLGAKSADPKSRSIGYAVSNSVYGPWQRLPEAIPLVTDCNNPAGCILDDGRTFLAFRCGDGMYIGMAMASRFDGNYKIVNPNITPGKILEDPYLFFRNGHYEIILHDIRGSISGHKDWGGHISSMDGITNWKAMNPEYAYDLTLVWDDGTTEIADRRERPQLLFDDAGEITHLITAVKLRESTRNIVQRLSA